MARFAMLVDLRRCVGCQACTVACQQQWGLEPEQRFTKVESVEYGQFPQVSRRFVTTQCMHCDNPPCQEVCPTGATYKRQDGIVVIDEDKCVGCQYCLTACPYGARTYNEKRSIVQKCSFCAVRLGAGQEPACVNTCLGQARIFGDLDDPKSAIAKASSQPGVLKVKGTAMLYIPPKGLARNALPADASFPGYVSAWKEVVQPVGKTLLGLTTGAVLLSLMMNTVSPGPKEESSDEEN
ncbi:MAG: 4Fe-4S dicluster domain-containing protein [Firmicutes bacterium]|nr:4Fe-4S dicluster domain-containing protein [Bacillota bacterium]